MLPGPYDPIEDPEERKLAVKLALGRILRMGSGDLPFDSDMFEKCQSIIRTNSEKTPDHRPNLARSYHGIVMRGDD